MLNNQDTIRLLELTKQDKHELTQELGETVQFKQETLTTDKAGEPFTLIAIVTLSALAIKGISMWLLKQRTRGEATFIVEVTGVDGSKTTQTVHVVISESASPPASVIEQVGAGLHVDQSLIDEAKSLLEIQ